MVNKNRIHFLVSSKATAVCIALVLVLSPLTFSPQKAQAQGVIAGAVAAIASCTSLSSLLGGATSSFGSVGSTVPVNDSVVRKTNSSIQRITNDQLNKECSLDTVAYATAKFLEQTITDNALNFIRTGFDGGPAFITDPSGYFLNIADKEVKSFALGPELNNIYGPYQSQLRKTLINNFNKRTGEQSYADKTKTCNLDNLVTDSEGFRSGNFAAGGWGAWLEATQNDFCNPYGLNKTIQEESDRRVSVAVEEKRVLADWGSGVQSVLDDNGNVTTPGLVIADQLNTVLKQGYTHLNTADELGEAVLGVIGSLMGDVFSPDGFLSN
jgi:hypothetical protein